MSDIKPRITVVETVYHCVPGFDGTACETQFTREVGSEEPPYTRLTKVGADRVPIPTGPIGPMCSVLVVKNLRPRRQVKPTAHEKAVEDATMVVLSASGQEFCTVPPGETLRITNPVVCCLTMHTLNGQEAQVSTTSYPH